MRTFKSSLAVAVLLCLVMSMVLPVDSQAADARKTNKEMQRVADPILDNILDSFKLEDYVAYSKDFDKTLKVVGSRTKFFKVARYLKESVGNYLYREYMGSIYKENNIVVLWKGSFDKTREDVLIKLFLSKQNNKYVVTGLRFQ